VIVYENSCRNLRNVRWILFQTSPFCHWCGTPVVFMFGAGNLRKKNKPKNICTIDHLTRQVKGPQAVVLACDPCNQFRQMIKAFQSRSAIHPFRTRPETFLRFKREYIERLKQAT